MNNLVHYSLQENIATIRIDDGKRNALSPELLREIYQALDQAESDRAAIILTGRESVFCAGFDLKVMKRGGIEALGMLRHRLVPAAFQRAVTLSQYFDPESALQAGFFDELVDPAELMLRAEARMNNAMLLDQRAHTVSKRRIRKALVRKLRSSVPLDLLDAALIGLRGRRRQ